MIESNFFIKRVNILLYLIFTLVFIYIVSHPVLEAKDSKGYIDAYINRSAVYPIFLWVMRSFFGNVSAIATLIVQATFGIVAVFIFFKINYKNNIA